MIQRLIIVLVVLAVVFGGIFGWKAYQGDQLAKRMAAMGQRVVTVSSAEVTMETWQRKINATGGLRAIQGVEVSPEVAGVVAAIRFQSGHRVEVNDVLVQLDATAEEAQLRSLQAQLVLAQQDYDRARGLEVKTVLSQAQLDRALSVLESLQARSEQQEALIARKTIRAPFSGELGIREINLGEYLSPGSTIVTLQQLNPIYVDFTLPEQYLHKLEKEQVVEIALAARPGEIFSGRVTAISPRVLSATRNVEIQATLDNTAGKLRPGMFTHVSVLLGEAESVMTLPRTAVDLLPYGNSVFVIEGSDVEGGDLVVRRQQVTTGRVQKNQIEIVEGLEPGQTVVRSGQLKLRNGQKIQVDNTVELPAGATRG